MVLQSHHRKRSTVARKGCHLEPITNVLWNETDEGEEIMFAM